MTQPLISPSSFREYDIRGAADRDLPNEGARQLGLALGALYRERGKRRIALGRDCRLSSPRLHGALREGLLQAGMSIVDIGVGPTPMMYFTVHHLDLDGGVQITGSHNPPEDNGFKMMCGKDTLFGGDIQQLRALIEQGHLPTPGGGMAEDYNPLAAYVDFMKNNIHLGRRDVRVAVDAGSGAGGPAAVAVYKALGIDFQALLCEMDGRFPVHHPDPTEPHNMQLLIDTVKAHQLELGIAFDGDADRVGVVDPSGRIIWGDQLMVLFARDILKRKPGAAILGEVKCSQTLYADIEKHGGRPIMWKTGHSLIKKKMKEEKAMLAGEMSGHIFFADRYYGFDDAIYASLRLIEILSATDASIASLLADLPVTYSTPEIRVECSDAAKFAVVERVAAHYRPTHKVIEVDGARVLFDGGWGLVRASNTQPVLVLRFEALSAARLDEIEREVREVIQQAQSQ
jgi:phosphomannomutase/phosphoglucomutase